jgi:hypothetical protein
MVSVTARGSWYDGTVSISRLSTCMSRSTLLSLLRAAAVGILAPVLARFAALTNKHTVRANDNGGGGDVLPKAGSKGKRC